jgi:DNA repair exonuclease SbcCD nuclease subunit
MRILHTSDLHIGSPLTSRLSPEKVRERKAELLECFERMIEEAVYQRVSVFIIAGDLFDTERITRSAAERVLGAIERHPSLDFLYLPGNHEKSALIDSGIPLPDNLKTFGEDWTYFDYGEVCFAGRSVIAEGMFDTLNLSYAKTNIAVLHGALSDGKSTGETIGRRELEGKHVDYLALGHYHSYSLEKIFDTGVAVYSGTPEGRGFDEVGEKGFVIIDADGRHARHSFHPFAKRRLRIVDVDLGGADSRNEVDTRVDAALGGIAHTDLVRVRLSGKRPPELFPDTDSIASRWQSASYHFEIRDESGIRIDPEDYKYDRSLKGEFIRLVASRTDISEAERDKIIRTGLAALMGECDEI